MEAHEYEKMAEVEDSMWWYRACTGTCSLVLERFLPARSARLLDAGCGTGGFLRALASAPFGCRLFGLDAWQPACAHGGDAQSASGRAGRDRSPALSRTARSIAW